MSSPSISPSVLFIGQQPGSVDYSDPSLPPGLTTDKIQAGIAFAMAQMTEKAWQPTLCLMTPDDAGIALLEGALASRRFDCVVIGAGIRMPPKSLFLFEKVLNTVIRLAPQARIAFNTTPIDTADAAARWL